MVFHIMTEASVCSFFLAY